MWTFGAVAFQIFVERCLYFSRRSFLVRDCALPDPAHPAKTCALLAQFLLDAHRAVNRDGSGMFDDRRFRRLLRSRDRFPRTKLSGDYDLRTDSKSVVYVKKANLPSRHLAHPPQYSARPSAISTLIISGVS